jgi:acyl-CoA hydrolase
MIIGAETAINFIQCNQTVVASMAAGEPRGLLERLGGRAREISGTRVFCANPTRDYSCFTDTGLDANVSMEVMFLTAAVRQNKAPAHVHYVPNHLSQWSRHIFSVAAMPPAAGKAGFWVDRTKRPESQKPVDVFWGSCSLPDQRGFVSLGLNACYEPEVLRRAKCVILEINPHMPVTSGATAVHLDEVDYLIEQAHELPVLDGVTATPEDEKIAGHVAELVPDEATIQLGIGAIPNAIGRALIGRRDLGVHTELINDAIMHLYEAGAINGSKKTMWAGKITGAFVYGSRKLYDFVDRNPGIELQPASLVNDPARIARNHRMTSINTAIEVDLTGQVCSESLGHREISGVGGATDTHVGAQRACAGRGIVALRSTTRDGKASKIVSALAPGAKVSISRNDIDTIVTEYGIAELAGKNVSQRARAMIAIAHPVFRDELTQIAKKEGYL